jgi:hypothetical protein
MNNFIALNLLKIKSTILIKIENRKLILYVQFTNGINEKQYRFFKGYIWIK